MALLQAAIPMVLLKHPSNPMNMNTSMKKSS
jgi:hypothetical protein